MKRTSGNGKKRSGFSLVELVVVVLIMGILAAVAAPKMFDKMTEARESASKQSVAVLRTAIDQYKVADTNNAYPATLDLLEGTYIKGAFPKVEVGAKKNANVKVVTADPIVVTADTEGWLYNATTGEIRINDASYITW